MKPDEEKETPSRRRGRPPSPVQTSTLSIRIPVHVHDRLIKLAKQRDKSVSQTGARLIMLGLPHENR